MHPAVAFISVQPELAIPLSAVPSSRIGVSHGACVVAVGISYLSTLKFEESIMLKRLILAVAVSATSVLAEAMGPLDPQYNAPAFCDIHKGDGSMTQ